MRFFKVVLVVGVLFCVSFLSPKITESKDILKENFTTRNDSVWLYQQADGSIQHDGTSILLKSDGLNFPYVLLKENLKIEPGVDYSVDIKFKFDRLGPSGDGISVGFTGNPYGYSLFSVWLDRENLFHFFYNDFNSSDIQGRCIDFSRTIDTAGRVYRKFSTFDSLGWHTLTAERLGKTYRFYLDRDVNASPFFVSPETDCIPKTIWLGNNHVGNYNWSDLRVDHIFVRDSLPEGSKNKIIILPGLGASWNEEAMVLGREVSADQWAMTPFVGNYDGLIRALEDNGLDRDSDFWVWNYDWTKPIDQIVTTFESFVDEKVPDGEKVDLVGHSLGGLVSRGWAQANSTDSRLGEVITLGSPHGGAVKAYESWMGGQVSDKFDFGAIAMKVLVILNRGHDQSDLETIRRMAPVVKDLLPTFDFVRRGVKTIAVSSLSAQNQWVLSHSDLTSVSGVLQPVVATGKPTLEWLNLGEISAYERRLGYWPDGKPVGRYYGEGDGTVLKKSATISGIGSIQVSSSHGEMVDGSINQVLTELGLGVSAVVAPVDYSAPKLVFYLGSPAKMTVYCLGMTEPVADDGGWVVVDDNFDQCRLTLVGTGEGTYHLVAGRSDSDVLWSYFEEGIGVGETKNLVMGTKNMELTGDGGVDYLYGLMASDNRLLLESYPNNIYLAAMAGWITARDEMKLMDDLFRFRRETKEMVVSQRMVDNLVSILALRNGGTTKAVSQAERKRAVGLRVKTDLNTRLLGKRKIYPSVFGSASYLRAEKMLGRYSADYPEEDWPGIWADSTVALRLLGEVW